VFEERGILDELGQSRTISDSDPDGFLSPLQKNPKPSADKLKKDREDLQARVDLLKKLGEARLRPAPTSFSSLSSPSTLLSLYFPSKPS
jgi:hypothetical protein